MACGKISTKTGKKKPIMNDIQVRPARLDDSVAISSLHRTHIQTWQRLDSAGRVEDVAYDALGIYARWLHGGAWMSVETGAIQLCHLLRGAGYPFVAEADGQIVGYTEAYISDEPAPYSRHLHMAAPCLHPDRAPEPIYTALLQALITLGQHKQIKRLTLSSAIKDDQAFYEAQGFRALSQLSRFTVPARAGQGFYRTVENPNPDAEQIKGWYMPLGRFASARQHWENLWEARWDAIPEIRQQKTHRLRFNAAGQDALIYCQQQLYVPRAADVYCWSPKPLTTQLLTALRDWSHREGYRSLVMLVPEDTISKLGAEAEPDGYRQTIYALDL